MVVRKSYVFKSVLLSLLLTVGVGVNAQAVSISENTAGSVAIVQSEATDLGTTDKFYITVAEGEIEHANKTIPDLTIRLEHQGVVEEVSLSQSNYDRDRRMYYLPFNFSGYSEGDTFKISFRGTDIGCIYRDDIVVKPDEVVEFKVATRKSENLLEDDTIEYDYKLIGSKEANMCFDMHINYKNSVFLVLQNGDGVPYPNMKVRVSSPTGAINKDIVSDSEGVVEVPLDEEWGTLKVYPLDGLHETVASQTVTTLRPGLRHIVRIEEVNSDEDKEIPNKDVLNVNITTKDTVLYNLAQVLNLRLYNKDQDYTYNELKLGNNELTMYEGNYTLENLRPDDVIFSMPTSVTVPSTVDIDFTSNRYLEVKDSENPSFKFRVANDDDLKDVEFTGASAERYGVIANQCLMITDITRGKTHSVTISEKDAVTTLDLATGDIAGVSTGNNNNHQSTSPATYDYIDIVLLIAAIDLLVLIIAIIGYIMNNRGNRKKSALRNTTKMLSLFLVGAMTVSLLPQSSVYAEIASGTPSSSVGGKSNPLGNLQAWNTDATGYSALVKLTLFVNNGDISITEDSTIEQLETDSKFWNDESAVYIATNEKDYARAQNGGIYRWIHDMVLEDGSLYSGPLSIFGKAFWNDSNVTNGDEYYRRLLPTNSATLEEDGRAENEFVKFFTTFFCNRSLDKNYGDDLSQYCKDSFSDETYENKVIDAYISYLQQYCNLTDEQAEAYREAYSEGNLVILVETCPGGYLKDISGADNTQGFYATVNDIMKIFNWQVSKFACYPSKEAQAFGEEYIEEPSYVKKFVGCGGNCDNAKCKTMGHYRYSAIKVLMEKYIQTIKPKSNTIDLNNNPFGGWGFLTLGTGSSLVNRNRPGIYGEVNYRIVDESGNVKEMFTKPINDYAYEDTDKNILIGIEDFAEMLIPATVEYNSKLYSADTSQSVPAKLYATDSDNYQKWFIDTTSDVNNRDLVLTETEISTNTTASTFEDGAWVYRIADTGLDILQKLDLYLGNDEDHGIYANTNKHGNVKVVFDVIITEIPQSLSGGDIVPQWRINKYYPSIMEFFPNDTEYSKAVYKLSLSSDSKGSHKKSYLSSDEGTQIKLNSPMITSLPFLSKAKSDAKLNNVKIKHANPTVSLNIWGDLMAFKDESVDNLTLANWLQQGELKYHRFNIYESEGVVKDASDSEVTIPVSLEYSFEPTKTIYHYIAKYSHKYGNCECFLKKESALGASTAAKYDASITFKCYNHTTAQPQVIAPTNAFADGYSEFTVQSSESFNVFAEVPMLYTDVAGKNTIKFTTADKATEIKPVSYHTLQFVTNIKPVITGVAVTDSKATAKLNELGSPMMFNKGTPTNTAYETNGKLIAKSYAVDFNSTKTYYKNIWNTGNSYSSEVVNSLFLGQLGNANVDGTYTADFKVAEKLKINGELYGDANTSMTVVSNKPQYEEYTLTVRAGEVTAVNGYTDWKSKYPELVVPIENKLNLTPSGVFSTFARSQGDILDEAEFADKASISREGSDSIAVGKGWYNEDTVLLSLYVYTTEFTLGNTVATNKIPMEIAGLETPQDKSLFYSKAYNGGVVLDIALSPVAGSIPQTALRYDSIDDTPFGETVKLYAVPNVSALDTAY